MNVHTVLQHAAMASLTCTGPRTIGPDQKPIRAEKPPNQQDKQSRHVEPVESALSQLSITMPTKQISPVEILPSVGPDLNDINASIVKREIEKECKRSVRYELNQIKERQQKAISERFASQRNTEQQQQQHINSRTRREESNKLIQKQAEQLAKAELEAQQREQNALLKQNNQKLHLLIVEGVSRCHRRFCSKYELVTKLFLALDKDTVQACAAQNSELRELAQLFDQLLEKLKMGSHDPPELSCVFTAEQYCQRLDKLEENLHKHLSEQHQQQLDKAKKLAEEQEKQRQAEAEEQQKQQALKEQQLAAERKAIAEAAATATAAAAAATTATAAQAAPNTEAPATSAPAPAPAPAPASAQGNISTSYVHPTRLAFYNEIIALYQSKVDAVKPLQTDEAWKKYRTNCQRTINLPLNAITATSAQHLKNNFDKLYNFFAGQPVRTTDGSTITINDHPLARDYCILLMAKKFVSQTDTAISSNPQAAFPFASVIVTFWKLLPDFGKIFLAYMYKESPYLVPYLIPQQPDQTPEQYLKTMGYRITENNQLEKPDMFLKRQTGIARLYAAVIITPGRQADGPYNCFGLEEAWRWFTHIIQLKPLPDICATMIMEMLQTLGFELWHAYGMNFLKLLLYIQNIYMPQLSAYDEGGPKTRLEMLLSKFLRERQIPQAMGVLPPGFW
ncbi:nucleoporin GLE1 isoform X2 [Drosophila navojoa]|nr:nucleoporin GLE1 isoform X2 [Drosophila navojoa]XP_030245867.1 nucleoporin GLE1 isoform X2 [Drosophila navojoa]